jgi:hypothetical protein
MHTADKMQLRGTESDGTFCPAQDFINFQNVGSCVIRFCGKSTERTTDSANVGRIDMGIDNVIRFIAVPFASFGIGTFAEFVKIGSEER